MLALSFARSIASMAFALRYSALPLIDSIMHLAFEYGVEDSTQNYISAQEMFDIERSSIDLQRFTRSKYFEGELQRSKLKPRIRKAPGT